MITGSSLGVLHFSLQEAEKEKEGVFEQFKSIIAAKEAVDLQNRNLLTQSNQLKKQIEEFEDRKSGLMVGTSAFTVWAPLIMFCRLKLMPRFRSR